MEADAGDKQNTTSELSLETETTDDDFRQEMDSYAACLNGHALVLISV